MKRNAGFNKLENQRGTKTPGIKGKYPEFSMS